MGSCSMHSGECLVMLLVAGLFEALPHALTWRDEGLAPSCLHTRSKACFHLRLELRQSSVSCCCYSPQSSSAVNKPGVFFLSCWVSLLCLPFFVFLPPAQIW